jgi:hypothetical protein
MMSGGRAHTSMAFLRRISLRVFLALLATAAVAAPAPAQHTSGFDAVRELARKIVVLAGPGRAIAIELRNASSLPAAEVAEIGEALAEQLRGHGVRVLERAEGAVGVVVTVAESLRGFLLAAEVRREGGAEIALAEFDRAPPAEEAVSAPAVMLGAQLVFAQGEPILDFSLVEAAGAPRLLVLETTSVTLYRMGETGWQLERRLPLEPEGPRAAPGRDPRGVLNTSGGLFTLYLPGVECSGTLLPAFEAACERGEGWWELPAGAGRAAGGVLVAGRNYFRSLDWFQPGRPTTQGQPPFYSVAALGRGGEVLWFYAGADGRTRVFDSAQRQVTALDGFGSQLTTVATGCGEGLPAEILLAGSAGDWTAPDTVAGYQFAGGRVVRVAEPVELPGPLLALSTDAEARRAFAVVRHLETGRYEAYILTPTCRR